MFFKKFPRLTFCSLHLKIRLQKRVLVIPAALWEGARPGGTQEPWGSDGPVPLAVPPPWGQDGPQEGSLPRGAAAVLGVSVPMDGPCAPGMGISSWGLALAASALHLPGAWMWLIPLSVRCFTWKCRRFWHQVELLFCSCLAEGLSLVLLLPHILLSVCSTGAVVMIPVAPASVLLPVYQYDTWASSRKEAVTSRCTGFYCYF